MRTWSCSEQAREEDANDGCLNMILRFEIGVFRVLEGLADWDNVGKLGIGGDPRLVKVFML